MSGYVDPNEIEPNMWNPEVIAAAEDLALLEDMKEHGLEAVGPVLISPSRIFYGTEVGHKTYVLVDGEHRWRHALTLKWTQLKADIQAVSEEDAKALNYRKNRERGTVDPFKEAALFQSEVNLKKSIEAIAEKYGVDATTVRHRLSLLRIDIEVANKAVEMPRGSLNGCDTGSIEGPIPSFL